MEPVSEASNVPIERLSLPARVYRCLKAAGLHTVQSVLQTNPAELMGLRNFGATSMGTLRRRLSRAGYRWNARRELDQKRQDQAALLGMDVSQIGFSDAMVERLHLAQIELAGELVTRSPQALLRYPGIGPRGLKIIRQVLMDLGLDIGMDLVFVPPGRWLDRLDHAREKLTETLRAPADQYLFAKEHGLALKTLRRFLRGETLTTFQSKKLRRLFLQMVDVGSSFDRTSLESYRRLKAVESTYRSAGGLKSAARQLGMSHEEVRRLLKTGAKFGIVSYRG